MKKNKLILNAKLKGVTLTEVLVAMSLLGIVLTFSMLISERVLTETSQDYTVKSQVLLDETLAAVKAKAVYVDFEEIKEEDGLLVKATFNQSILATDLLELELSVYDEKSSTLILAQKHLINAQERN